MKEYVGDLQGKGLHIGIVISRFNEVITRNLLSGALDALRRHGVQDDHITVAWVPGAFEIPLITKRLAMSEKFDALLCLGALIKGETAHFEYVAGQAVAGIAKIGLEYNLPVVYEVLTTNNIEEAIARAGSKAGNKGFDGAVCAIEMANLARQI